MVSSGFGGCLKLFEMGYTPENYHPLKINGWNDVFPMKTVPFKGTC